MENSNLGKELNNVQGLVNLLLTASSEIKSIKREIKQSETIIPNEDLKQDLELVLKSLGEVQDNISKTIKLFPAVKKNLTKVIEEIEKIKIKRGKNG